MIIYDYNIVQANQNDYDNIIELLKSVDLPIEGVKENLINYFTVKSEEGIIGVAGYEIYNELALLRSVAIKKLIQKSGLGQNLIHFMLSYAKNIQINRVYLLTDTASKFFEKLGFIYTTREDVESDVKQSVEFKICPDSSIVMVKFII